MIYLNPDIILVEVSMSFDSMWSLSGWVLLLFLEINFLLWLILWANDYRPVWVFGAVIQKTKERGLFIFVSRMEVKIGRVSIPIIGADEVVGLFFFLLPLVPILFLAGSLFASQ